ncbi:MAG TPA: protein phosphatase 2C domain-containing protein [Pyrinomonadaceae bacterium]|nr:protein phosphatase 2C domain-containing protein [Pyrinomonadaceae bacterium]
MFIVEVHATSHIGRVRKGNEDNYLVLSVSDTKRWTGSQDGGEFVIESQKLTVDDNGVIVAVSDGMGGALAGEVASTMAVETVSERILEDDSDKTLTPEEHDYFLISKLYNATVYANYLIHNQGRTDPQYQGMGATFTGIAVSPKFADVIQVGDSRAYLVRNGKIYQVTKDQSLVQQLIDTKQISPEEAESHNLKNVILQALGAQSDIYPISARIEPHRNDVFLICSDGLSNKVSAANMQRIVEENIDSLEQACAELIREANSNGGEDNITVILSKFTGDNLPDPTGDELKLELLDLGGIHDTADQEDMEDTAEIV